MQMKRRLRKTIFYLLPVVVAVGLIVVIWQLGRVRSLRVGQQDSTVFPLTPEAIPRPAKREWSKRLTHAMFDISRGEREVGMRELREIVDNAPPSRTRAEAMMYLGNRLAVDKQYDEAFLLLNEALKATEPESPFADPKRNAEITAHLAYLKFHASRFDESLLHATEARARQGMSEEDFHMLSAMNLAMLSKWDQAYDHLGKLHDTNDPLCQTLLSLAYEHQGRQEMAEQAQSRAEALNKSEAVIWRRRFKAHSRPPAAEPVD